MGFLNFHPPQKVILSYKIVYAGSSDNAASGNLPLPSPTDSFFPILSDIIIVNLN